MHEVELKVSKTYSCGNVSAMSDQYDEWVISSKNASYRLCLNRGLIMLSSGSAKTNKELSQILAVAARISFDRDQRE